MRTVDRSRVRLAVLGASAAAVLISVTASALSAANGRPPEIYVPVGISGLVYATTGTVVLLRRPDSRIGAMLMFASIAPAFLVAVRYLFPVVVPINISLGTQINFLPIAFVVLTFPSGRFRGLGARRVFSAALLIGGIGALAELLSVEPRLALGASCSPCTTNPVRILDPSLYPVMQDINGIASIGVAAAMMVVVILRWRGSRGLTRTALTPLIAGGIALALLYAAFVAVAFLTRVELPLSGSVLLLVRMLIPIGLAIVLLRFYGARSAVARDILRMGRTTSVGGLEQALQRSLKDPTITIGRWSPSIGGYVDGSGKQLVLDEPGLDDGVLLVGDEEGPIAAVVHDAALGSDQELLEVIAESVRHAMDVGDLREELTARGGDVARLPTGEVTFLFGDMEHSTQLLAQLGDGYGPVLEAVRSHVRAVADRHAGQVVDMRADECFVVFAKPLDALRASQDLQRRLAESRWPETSNVRLRIGLHTGRPNLTSSGYLGIDVHQAARVMGAARGGQTVASSSFAAAVEGVLPTDVSLTSLGSFALRGLPGDHILFEMSASG